MTIYIIFEFILLVIIVVSHSIIEIKIYLIFHLIIYIFNFILNKLICVFFFNQFKQKIIIIKKRFNTNASMKFSPGNKYREALMLDSLDFRNFLLQWCDAELV